jgi:hypothetical protein
VLIRLPPKVFAGAKMNKAMDCWADTLDVLYGAGVNIPATTPDTWPGWGKEHTSARSGWRWRVDVDPLSPHFGCLQIARDGMPMSYLHGDYDLKDVIVKGMETYNQRLEGKVQGAKNYTPLLPGLEFETIRKALNEAIGVDMVQHGAEAQFAWHGDEPITVILPDGPQLQFKVLLNAEAVQRWYIERNREVIAKKGKGLHRRQDTLVLVRQPRQPVPAGNGPVRLMTGATDAQRRLHTCRGSSASRSPSPSRLKASTRPKVASPGQIAIQGALSTKLFAVLSMLPQPGAGGCWPRPRNDRLASAITAPAIAKVLCTISSAVTLGSTWRSATRQGEAPSARAAST